MEGKWKALERQRPQLKIAKWGGVAGAAVTAGSVIGLGSVSLGVAMMVGFGAWGYTVLKK